MGMCLDSCGCLPVQPLRVMDVLVMEGAGRHHIGYEITHSSTHSKAIGEWPGTSEKIV